MTRQQRFKQLVEEYRFRRRAGDRDHFNSAALNLAEYFARNADLITIASDPEKPERAE